MTSRIAATKKMDRQPEIVFARYTHEVKEGLVFQSMHYLRGSAMLYAHITGAPVKAKRNTQTRYVLACVHGDKYGCTFALRGRGEKGGKAWVTFKGGHHQCQDHPRSMLSLKLTSEVLASAARKQLLRKPNSSLEEVKNCIKDTYGIDVDQDQARNVKRYVKNEKFHEEWESFQQFPAFLQRCQQQDPTGHFHLQEKDGCFHQFFLAPGALRAA